MPALACTPAEQAGGTPPNILLVMVDNMGWTDIGCFGSEIETPNIDKLADRGVRFNDFHVSVSCSPTRSMLLSGTSTEVYGADEYFGGEMGNGKWVRRGDFKAVYVPKPYGNASWQLFNVVGDPGETRDLGAEMPELLKDLQAAWDRYAEEVGVVPAEE